MRGVPNNDDGNDAVGEAAEDVNRAYAHLDKMKRLVRIAEIQAKAARGYLFKALDERAAIPGKKPAICGTPVGYHHHRENLEPSCYACLQGLNWDRRYRGKSK